jgi:endoglucanase
MRPMRRRAGLLALLALALPAAPGAAAAADPIRLQADGHFAAPGFALLVYHNRYIVGRAGGVEAILHGRRVFDAGQVVVRGADGRSHGGDAVKVGERVADAAAGTARVEGSVEALGFRYALTVSSDGASLLFTVSLDQPVDWARVEGVAFELELFPEQFWHKSYFAGPRGGLFPERNAGPVTFVAAAPQISLAPEDPLTHLVFASADASLRLEDRRRADHVQGFTLSAALPPRSTARAFSLRLTPRIEPSWRKASVLRAAQAGYRPEQVKQAVLEMDPRDTPGPVRLERLRPEGGVETVREAAPRRWGTVFDSTAFTFDFSDVRLPGLYQLRHAGETLGPFRIDREVLQDAWKATLDVYFPVQMCHVEVRQDYRIWRGRCHLDDARQAPPNIEHFDGYRQGAPDSPFAPDAAVPGLTWGGWHDAGDTDLPVGGNATTALLLALAHEEFKPARDVTSVRREDARVELFRPDGRDDLLQQVAYGVSYILAMYRAFGHAGVGVIDRSWEQYLATGDPAFTSDGRPDSGDERWAFSNRNTGGQYQVAQLLAVAARVLRGFDDPLAAECLRAARALWDFEQGHPPVGFEVAYQPQERGHAWELRATAELLLTTGEAKYRERLLALRPEVARMPARAFLRTAGGALVRALDRVDDAAFRAVVVAKAKEARAALQQDLAWSPYGVTGGFAVWGNGWDVLDLGAELYFFARHLPQVFEPELQVATVAYVLGHHPGSAVSYVSGLGRRSATVAFGFNRSEYSYIPGGVVSGATFLRPRYIEYRDSPWDWYITEYVMNGAAAYVFDVLAADALLARGEARP